jgi:hypothetical protein
VGQTLSSANPVIVAIFSQTRKRAVVTHLITFACYGCHLHGDESGSVDREHSLPESYASRCLNRMGLDQPARKRWARHGSTRWLWKAEDVSAAVRYVGDEQGERMSVFEASSS